MKTISLVKYVSFIFVVYTAESWAGSFHPNLPCAEEYKKRHYQITNNRRESADRAAIGTLLTLFPLMGTVGSDARGVTLVWGPLTAGLGTMATTNLSATHYFRNRQQSLTLARLMVEQLTLGDQSYINLQVDRAVTEVTRLAEYRFESVNLSLKANRVNTLTWEEFLAKNPIDREKIANKLFAKNPKLANPIGEFNEKFKITSTDSELREILEPLMTEVFLCPNPKDPLDAHMIARKLKQMNGVN